MTEQEIAETIYGYASRSIEELTNLTLHLNFEEVNPNDVEPTLAKVLWDSMSALGVLVGVAAFQSGRSLDDAMRPITQAQELHERLNNDS